MLHTVPTVSSKLGFGNKFFKSPIMHTCKAFTVKASELSSLNDYNYF